MSKATRSTNALPDIRAQAAIVVGETVLLEWTVSLPLALAASALCAHDPPCALPEGEISPGLCENCARVMGGDHPDLLRLDASDGKDQIGRVRAMRAAALTRPFLSERRVFLIDHAEGLSEASQNALLKVMEEPPSYARFLLLAARAEALLPTVRSRCAVYRLYGGTENAVAPEADGPSEQLLKAVLAGSELEVCRVVMGWTRMPREEFARLLERLLERTVQALAEGRGEAARLYALADVLRQLLDAQERNLAVSAACAKLMSQNPRKLVFV